MSSADATATSKGYSFHRTMLRIKDPARTVPFYRDVLGMRHVHTMSFGSVNIYFFETARPDDDGSAKPEPGTDEAMKYLWTLGHTVVALLHNAGTETQEDFKINNGNVEPHRGFGHIALTTDDVYKTCAELEAKGVKFQKKPDEGRMKGLAFALDPDQYWIEIIRRPESSPMAGKGFSYNQTMLRIKDPKLSIPFYCNHFGMTLVEERFIESGNFSLYFLATLPEGTEVPPSGTQEAADWRNGFEGTVLELTHNHGTEDDPDFKYHNGTDEPQGFGHIGLLLTTGDFNEKCAELEAAGVKFKKRPQDGGARNIAFLYDPDGYLVEIIPKGFSV